MSTPAINHYLNHFRQLGKRLTGDGLEAVRNAGMENLQKAGFPGLREENWKYTDVRPIVAANFCVPHTMSGTISKDAINNVRLAGLDCHELVFINGCYAGEYSSTSALPEGVIIADLADAASRYPDVIAEHIAHYADPAASPFTALNTAFIQHGCLIFIPPGVTLDKPVHLLFLSGMQAEPFATHPRNLIILAAQARATVIESYSGLNESVYFTNTVTEARLQDGAILQHFKIQQENLHSYHIGSFDIVQGPDSQVESHSITIGALLARNDIRARLASAGAGITLNGLYLAGGHQHIDNHTRVDHLQPFTRSQENYRGVLNGSARGVFNGKIVVHKDAQKTDASQSNANLLLSDSAEVDTKPELEIYADDVKCAHGATVGQLDQDMLFYLRSRAIDETTARSLLTYAFIEQVIQQIGIAPLRRHLEQMVIGLLPDPELIREFAA